MRGLALRALHAAHRVSLLGQRRRFERAARDCEAAQLSRLRGLVQANAGSAYGRAHDFGSIDSLRAWRSRVPIVGYDELEPWIGRAACGEAGVLTSAAVRVFERSSGSTAPDKLIPYTDASLLEFGAATGPWLHDLYASLPELRGTTSYWSISPAGRRESRTPGGIPIGFQEDTEYFAGLARLVLRRSLAVPPEVARLEDLDAWSLATLRHLAGAADLGLVSVWHPSFFTLLMRRLEGCLEEVLESLPSRRASEIRSRLDRLPLGQAFWPRLGLVSCWADGAAADALDAMRRFVPHARIQPKGLLATEGVVTVPLFAAGASRTVAAVSSHFLEFVDLESPAAPPRLAHELRRGGRYSPLLSTGGGLYRYRLGDVVRCTDFHGQAPCLRFEGRADHVADVCGEKLSADRVAAALERARGEAGVSPLFVMVAPAGGDPPRYHLYAEGIDAARLVRFGDIVERAFSEGHGYGYARSLGQLAPLEVVAVQDGATRYIRGCAARGQRPGDVKPASLDVRPGWREVFTAP